MLAQDVAAGYGGGPVWSGATFEIGADELVAVLGPNGAGKSTLLKMLLGLLPVQSGHLEVLGRPPRRANSEIGYVPQQQALDSELSIRGEDLVALGLEGHRWGVPLPGPTRRSAAARVADLVHAVGADSYGVRRVAELSGGERQRLLLAQALASNPRLLLLDEPLASLDLRNQLAMAHLVHRLARERGATVLLVAHDVNPLLPVATRVMYLGEGGVAIGKPEEVIRAEVLSALYRTPVEVLTDKRGRVFVVGLEEHGGHLHGASEPEGGVRRAGPR